MGFLQDLRAAKKQSTANALASVPPDLRALAGTRERPQAFDFKAFSVIAEIKRASPSKGDIANHPLSQWVQSLDKGGAAMLSVLTERHHFKGSLETLAEVGQHTKLPLLRKDFLWEPYELDEAIACGASAVLLIVAFLEDKLPMMAREAANRGLPVLVEVHGEDELDAAFDALAIAKGILGVNQRNLDTLKVDKRYAEALLPKLPRGTPFIVESGIEDARDLHWAKGIGAAGVLVGEALARAPDPGERLAEWLR